MSKHWTPAGQRTQLRPSRIRREPVRLEPVRELTRAELDKVEARSRAREVWGGVAGVVVIAMAVAALAVGIGALTFSQFALGVDVPDAPLFGQCYNSDSANCVLDGDTIRVGGETVEVAGVKAANIHGAKCEDERSHGIDAAMRLAGLLNSGKVSLGRAFTDPLGRAVREVRVNGQAIAPTLIDDGVAHRPDDDDGWC